MRRPRTEAWLAGAFAAAIGCLPALQAQSSDALLDKLVEKGILTTKEANELKQETDKGFNTAMQSKLGIPDWVTAIKLGGDFRGRFEENNAVSTAYSDRDRFRYRLRFGAVVSLENNFDIGLRLASGNPMTGGAINSNPGGSSVSANTDFNSLDSRKFIWIDAAFARWTPLKTGEWTLSGTIGKMDNPFQLSNMVWDYDINPEGGALQLAFHPSDKHALKMNSGIFVLDEINQGVGAIPTLNPNHDPYLYGAQVVWEGKWHPRFETALGVAGFNIVHKDSLNAKAQPLYNSGNTRDVNGFLAYNMNPIVGTASATYKLTSFPGYAGEFPIKVLGEYIDNPGAASNHSGYRVGVGLGKGGKKGTWELNYRYQRLDADAWLDALVDDDNGAYYAAGNPQLVGTGKTSGWFGGTNVRGHLVQASYFFTDYLNLSFTYYLNDLIINAPGQTSDASHFMADLMWKF